MISTSRQRKLAPTSNYSFPEKFCFLGFFITALLLWGICLGDLPLNDWDEATRALISREIYRSGNWLYPTLHGEPYFFKPPLMHWLIALSYRIGGVTEFTTRLPAAFFSACGVPLLYFIGREIFLEHLPAIFATSVYLTLLPVVHYGRQAMLDGISVSFFLFVLLCLLKCRQDRRWAVGMGLGLGAITFTKGLLVVPLGAIAGTFVLINKQQALFKSFYLWLGILLGNLPALVWYAAQWLHYGDIFLQIHFQAQGLERISKPVDGNTGQFWYYLFELLKLSLPWLMFLPGGLYLAWQQRHKSWGKLVLIGTVSYLGIISIMTTKLPWYIMPLYPFFALEVGAYLAQLWHHPHRYPRIFVVILGLLAVVGTGGCIYFILADPQPALIIMSLAASLTMAYAAWEVKQNNPKFIPILFVGMYLSLVLVMTSKSWLWELYEAFPVQQVAVLIQTQTKPHSAIYMSFYDYRPSLDFYSERQVIPADTKTLQKLWSTQPYLLLDQPTLAKLNLPNGVALGAAEGYTLIAPKSKLN